MVGMSAPQPEHRDRHAPTGDLSTGDVSTEDDIEAWRDLQAVLEERDREWWAEARSDDPDE
jgi:hypothetical protein